MLKHQQGLIASTIQCYQEALDLSFTEFSYGSAGYELDSFFELVAKRRLVLEQHAATEAEVNRQMALLNPGAAGAGDAMDDV